MRDKAKKLAVLRPENRSAGRRSVAALAIVGHGDGAIGGIGVKPTGAGAVKTGTNCGDTVVGRPDEQERRLHVDAEVAAGHLLSYPDKLVASPWATTKIKAKPPWKIGYISDRRLEPVQERRPPQLKKEFALAKAKGLVTGSLVTQHPAEPGAIDA